MLSDCAIPTVLFRLAPQSNGSPEAGSLTACGITARGITACGDDRRILGLLILPAVVNDTFPVDSSHEANITFLPAYGEDPLGKTPHSYPCAGLRAGSCNWRGSPQLRSATTDRLVSARPGQCLQDGQKTGFLPCRLTQNGQTDRSLTSALTATAFLWRQDCFGILPELFGRLEKFVVAGVVFVFTIVGGIVATDCRPIFVHTAAVIFLQVFAVPKHHQKPRAVFDENRHASMHHVPADVLIIVHCLGRIDGQRKIPTALGRAVVAQDFTRLQVFTANFWFYHRQNPQNGAAGPRVSVHAGQSYRTIVIEVGFGVYPPGRIESIMKDVDAMGRSDGGFLLDHPDHADL